MGGCEWNVSADAGTLIVFLSLLTGTALEWHNRHLPHWPTIRRSLPPVLRWGRQGCWWYLFVSCGGDVLRFAFHDPRVSVLRALLALVSLGLCAWLLLGDEDDDDDRPRRRRRLAAAWQDARARLRWGHLVPLPRQPA